MTDQTLGKRRGKKINHQYRTLLEVTRVIITHKTLLELFADLARHLHPMVEFDQLHLSLHDPSSNVIRTYGLAPSWPTSNHLILELPFEESLIGWVMHTQQPLIIPNMTKEPRFPKAIQAFVEHDVKSYCALPLTTAQRRLGALGLISKTRYAAFHKAELGFLQQVADQVAVAVDNALNFESAQALQQHLCRERDHMRLLLEVTRCIASHKSLPELFENLAKQLHPIIEFDHLGLSLYVPSRNVMQTYGLYPPHSTPDHIIVELPIEASLTGRVMQTQQPLIIPNVVEETRFPKAIQSLIENGFKSFCALPLTTAQRRLGALGFGSATGTAAYLEPDLEFLQQVTNQVAVAVDNASNFEAAESLQQHLASERDHLSLLLKVNNAVVSKLDLRQLFASIEACLHQSIRHENASLILHDSQSNQLRLSTLDPWGDHGLIREGDTVPMEGTPAGLAFTSRRALLLDRQDLEQFPDEVIRQMVTQGAKSMCCVPLLSGDRVLGTLNMLRLEEPAFTQADLKMLGEIANQISIAVENALSFGQIKELKDLLAEEKMYLEDEIQNEGHFEEIIGNSEGLKHILRQVEMVAPTDSTVLIQGETGTGKELIARAIHRLSGRHERTFVKINCSAIPAGLLESDLFGHEKGAFTGAVAQHIGRFELAHRGTLYLDEVGDLPLELQPKLLRVLQEREFERLGSTRTIRVDTRVVAATNRDLARMVQEKQFREDLYYRLNVFPITMPPLRQRRQDIPLLVGHFVQKHAHRMKKCIERLPHGVMAALKEYPWPGNVRELENLVERAVILTRGPVLEIPLIALKLEARTDADGAPTLAEAEREYILRALRECNWIISGPRGAAARLGLKRTTLNTKLKKLNISRPESDVHRQF